MNGKKNLYILAAMFFVALLTMPAVSADEHADNEDTVKAAEATSKGYIAIGAALAVGLAGIGTGLAQSNIGSAAIGAVAEDDKNFTNGLIFTAIPETIVIFGLVIFSINHLRVVKWVLRKFSSRLKKPAKRRLQTYAKQPLKRLKLKWKRLPKSLTI